ncbi:tetratricopeptide repeat protein [Psychroserpens sp. NJDZ02]|uniref:tetratricopeptide repeat protein n=1 Tax=Psychroserpens sp. NJDZ02 TaxID=2570561 RepID=UPI0010A907B3|nr:tetratricopeptide repeat protein [Psychroserpens sp. NJDZ02]QCE43293.1 sel1 repeat family protein [Psychroserpens sp. NJDZ02]
MKYKIQVLLISLLYIPCIYSQNPCFDEETIKVYKESKKEDHKESLEWLFKASKVNHGHAIHQLGLYYVQGSNLDYKKAYAYFEKSAYLGIHNSMRSLGIMNEDGEGREIDFVKAYAWYRLAGDFIPTHWDEWYMPRSKIRMFKSMAPKLANKMTEKEIRSGDKLYNKIKSKINCNFNSWLEESDYFIEKKKPEQDIKIPNSQLQEIIELALNLPELQMYYHIDQAPKRLPLKIKEFDKINEKNLKGIKMFGKNILFLKDREIKEKRISDYITVSKWTYSKNKLNLILKYPIEGIIIIYNLERKDLEWTIVSSQIRESKSQ